MYAYVHMLHACKLGARFSSGREGVLYRGAL